MIIGNGMIANIFKDKFKNDDIVIFASGVSNSKEISKEAFEREISLIQDVIQEYPSKLFVYFSTCSVHNYSKSKYIEHKVFIENTIINSCEKYLILRLPIVLGRNQNKHQLIGYLFEKNKQGELIEVFKNSNRYLIDSDDLPTIVNLLINKGVSNEIIEVAFNNSLSIDVLLKMIENITKKPFVKKISNIESIYIVDNKKFLATLNDSEFQLFNLNIESMLLKYYLEEK